MLNLRNGSWRTIVKALADIFKSKANRCPVKESFNVKTRINFWPKLLRRSSRIKVLKMCLTAEQWYLNCCHEPKTKSLKPIYLQPSLTCCIGLGKYVWQCVAQW